MSYIGIDPGEKESAIVIIFENKIIDKCILMNHEVLDYLYILILDNKDKIKKVAIEKMQNYGIVCGESIFQTIFWSGRFYQDLCDYGLEPHMITGDDIKIELCDTKRIGDKEIRERLIQIYGKPGTKKQPGGTYGIKSHMWTALAVAHTLRVKSGRFI